MTALDHPISISYIIPARDSETSLAACLESLFRQTHQQSFEIIVVDNSPLKSMKSIALSFNTRYVWEKKAGAAATRNRGLTIAQGKYVVFLDSDVVLETNWTQTCLDVLSAPWIDCVQTPIYPASRSRRFWMLWWRREFIGAKTQRTFNYLTCAVGGWPVVNSAAFMIKRSRFQHLKVRFNEKLIRCEDLDMTYQLTFGGCHFAEAEGSFARVYDQRSFPGYLRRSFNTGFFTEQVKSIWLGKQKVSLFPSFLELRKLWSWEPSAILFIKLNQFSSLMGQLFYRWRGQQASLSETAKAQTALTPDWRNTFFFRAMIETSAAPLELSLSPYIRIVSLKKYAVLIDVSTGRSFTLEASERLFFKNLMELSGSRFNGTDPNFNKLLLRLHREGFLTAQQ